MNSEETTRLLYRLEDVETVRTALETFVKVANALVDYPVTYPHDALAALNRIEAALNDHPAQEGDAKS